MKLIKGFGLLSFLAILSGSCFDPPEFPTTPQIEDARVLRFIAAKDPIDQDSLVISLKFKDGNGDLGFRDTPEDMSAPFHSSNFYQENNGKLEPLSTRWGYLEENQYELLEIPNPDLGKVVVYRTRKKAEYSFLPPPDKCGSVLKYYEYLGDKVDTDKPGGGGDGRRLVIEARAKSALDPLVQVVDSFPKGGKAQYYQIRDTLYFTPNPDHYNIEVDFLIKDPSAPDGFVEYDWREEFCQTFDARFPVLNDGESSVDGTLEYAIVSYGISQAFTIKTLKLRINIKDRQGNRSNIIETPEFTLH